MRTHEERLAECFYLGWQTLGYNKFTELHLGWFDDLLRYKRLLLIAPPGHLKSTCCTITYPLFRLTEDRNLRIMIVNEILDNAKGFLGAIKTHIRDTEAFRERYGDWHIDAEKWSDEKIQLSRSEVLKEPTIQGVGVMGTLVSQHPSLIIVDDPCSNRNTQTASQRRKVWDWFRRDLVPRLTGDGQIVVISTRWHRDDLAGMIKRDPGYSDWKIIEMAADWKDDKGGTQVLFPEEFNPEKLRGIRAQLGTANYQCIYRSAPETVEGTDFKAAWLDSGRYDKLPEALDIFAGIDLAIGTDSRRNSCFAYIVIGVDVKNRGDVYVMDGLKAQLPFTEQLKAAKRIHHIHHPRIIVPEGNGFQAAFTQTLRSDKETRDLPLRPHTSQGDKHARLRGLAPRFELGAIRLPRSDAAWVEQLEEEILGFPDGTLDLMDALNLALEGVNMQRVEPRIILAGDDAA
ncbi:MAG: hypothetical protein WC728_03865 [Elusimicrobiota bacterium]